MPEILPFSNIPRWQHHLPQDGHPIVKSTLLIICYPAILRRKLDSPPSYQLQYKNDNGYDNYQVYKAAARAKAANANAKRP